MHNPNISYFATSNFRGKNTPIGIKQADRLYHMYLIGKTGTGKTTMMKNFVFQDIKQGRGLALLDPHGDLVESIYNSSTNKENIMYLDLTDPKQLYRYNPIRRVAQHMRPLLASGILSVFENLYKDAWGSRVEHILRYTILALLDQPHATLRDIPRILLDKIYRKQCQRHIQSVDVQRFWKKEFYKYREDALAPVLSKTGAFLSYPVVKRLLVQGEGASISLRSVMDTNKVLLVNLSKGIIGDDAAELIGSLLITSMGLSAFSRANIPEKERNPFMIYIDEFQNFTGGNSMESLLSELRKYKVGLVLAHQYMDQLDTGVRNAILGNVGTLISFRLGPRDAAFVAKEFYPTFEAIDLQRLANYSVYVKLMIDGRVSEGFSGVGLTNAPLHDGVYTNDFSSNQHTVNNFQDSNKLP